jgi:hypothetical protein
MSSDGVEATTLTASVDSSADLIDRIVRSVLDGQDSELPDYFPEELLRLETNENNYVRDAESNENDSLSADGSAGTNSGSHDIRGESSYRYRQNDENLCRCCTASGRICQVVTSDDSRKSEIVASASTGGKNLFTYNCFTGEKSHELHSIIARERGRAVYLALQLRHIMETVRSLYAHRGALDVYSRRVDQLNEIMRKWSVNLNMFDAKKPAVLYRL